jgi:uncharacterized membrane protein YhhN
MMTLLVVCAWATLLHIVAERFKAPMARAITKTAASTAFVGAALAGGAWVGPNGRLMVVALALSWLGDMLLLRHDRGPFLAGIVAFLFAHVAFAAVFLKLGPQPLATLAAAAPLLVVGGLVYRALAPRAGSLARPVLAYILAIVAMVALSFGAASSTGRWDLPLAATLFFLSDLTVARDRFVLPAWENRLLGLPLYYGAQMVFAVAAGTLG